MSESEKEKILARLKSLSKPSQIAVLLAVKEAKQDRLDNQPKRKIKSLARLEAILKK